MPNDREGLILSAISASERDQARNDKNALLLPHRGSP